MYENKDGNFIFSDLQCQGYDKTGIPCVAVATDLNMVTIEELSQKPGRDDN